MDKYKVGMRVHVKDLGKASAGHVPYGYCMVTAVFENLHIIKVKSEYNGSVYEVQLT